MISASLLHSNDRLATYPPSWYAATATGHPDTEQLTGAHETDIAIIGGGFTGLSAALHLSKRGFSVALLDAHRVGWGASGRNGGQVGTGQRVDQDELEQKVAPSVAQAAWDIAEQSKALVRSLIEEYDIKCDYRAGSIHANHRQRYDSHSRYFVERLQDKYQYPHIRYVPKDEMRHLVASADYFGGSLDMGAGHLHPLNYALGLARAAKSHGTRLFERSEVLRVDKGDPAVIHTAHGILKSRFVLYACNGYIGRLAKDISRRVMPINNYIIATEPLGEDRARKIISNNACVADSRFVVNYFRFSNDHRMLFGGGESYGYKFPKDIREFVRKPMLKIFPELRNTKIEFGWGGTLAITVSRLPFFHRHSPNILSASGYSGSGVALATGAGAMLAEAIEGTTSRFDVMNQLPTPLFPGGATLRSPLLALAMTWYALRDRL
ncbi:NAD(P)/FAD-dependent oxidoreductase [Arenicellales bacterium nBUS_45]